jgi:hypothetical protein
MRIAFAFWPGTLIAWRHGDVRALLIAWLFGLCLNVAWIGSTLWPMWMSPMRLTILWGALITVSVLSAAYAALRGHLAQPTAAAGCPNDRLLQAQEFYLQANYFEAEQILLPYCRSTDLDIEAALLLASILRRTERYPQAVELLEEMALLDRSWRWQDEIEQEKRLALKQKIRSQTDSL